MKTAIYGAGSLGTVLGAYITKAGYQIDLINRNKEHIEGLKKNGARITGRLDMTVPVSALLPGEMKEKYDIIFLMTKQLDNKSVVEGLTKNLSDDGVICTMQNGLPELSVSEVIGADRTYGCAIAWGATLIGGGVVELTSDPSGLTFGLGSLKGHKGAHYEEIKKLLQTMGTVEEDENFMGARWAKLLTNTSFSGLSAVLGCTFGEIVDNKEARLYAQRIIKECIDVAKAADIKIEPIQGKDVAKLLDYNSKFKQKLGFMLIPVAMKKHRLLKASMLQDLEKGKPTEIDAIVGVVCDWGDKVGVETPYCDKVREIVKRIEKKELKYTMENIAMLRGVAI